MPRGRNFYGPGFWWRGSMGWPGWGAGNPYPFCRNFPWLPRGWWAMGLSPFAYPGRYAYPGAGTYGLPAAWSSPFYWGVNPGYLTPDQELEALRQQSELIQNELKRIEERIKELENELQTED